MLYLSGQTSKVKVKQTKNTQRIYLHVSFVSVFGSFVVMITKLIDLIQEEIEQKINK